ncbi:MAG: carbohydrate-binding domain-containing protein [Eubacteriales bacterium]|nr:carbohydrate-binding domain-containing protein [Eubacteriales bacterium]
MKNTRYKKLLSVVIALLMLTSCATNATNTESDIAAEQNNTAESTSTINPETETTDGEYYPEAKYSDFDLNTSVSDSAVYVTLSGSQAETTGELEVGDGYIKIENGGDYVLSGDYSGQIIVESEENVHLILSGVTIYNAMAPIYVKSAKNVCITLVTGTVNTISDNSEYTYEDGENEPAAAVYSKADLTINGDGELIVNANYDKGIHSKDDLKIISGKITVNSVGDAIKGKDCLLIKDGEITITTGVDGLKSNNDSNEEKGYVIIEGGKIKISAGDDAVHAESWLIVYGGEINITECYEGLEGKKVEIYGGDINIVSSDDSINAASGSSGDTDFTIPDKDFNFSNFNSEDGQTPPEMSDSDNTDGTRPEMPSGDFTTGDGQTPPDKPAGDGTGDDSTSSGFGKGGFGGFGGFGGGGNGGFNEHAEDGVYIKIFGGNITLSGGNDVLDSNGTLEITGGTITVNNPNMVVYGEPDCIIDVNGTATVSGGTFIAYSRGATSASQAFTVPYITSSVTESGVSVTVKDSSGQTVIEIASAEKCSTLYIASDKLTSGETYTVTVGSTTTEVTAQ